MGAAVAIKPTVPDPRLGGGGASTCRFAPGTDDQFVTLLTTGIARMGKPSRQPMPRYRMPRADAEAVLAYLTSLEINQKDAVTCSSGPASVDSQAAVVDVVGRKAERSTSVQRTCGASLLEYAETNTGFDRDRSAPEVLSRASECARHAIVITCSTPS